MNVCKLLVVLLLAGCTAGQCYAQDSLSFKEAQDIRYRAQRMISKELSMLLNTLSNADFGEQDATLAIHNSHSGDINRIFRDERVTIEYDVNPSIRSSARSQDEDVDKYLKDFELLYQKSDNESVLFTNLSSSPVKKADRLYVKVYFNSLFKNKNTGTDTPFVMTNRVAEINAVKDKNKWALSIARIAFFNPADTAGDALNNIAIYRDAAAGVPKTFASAQDSVAAVTQQSSLDEEQQREMDRKYREEEAMKENTINGLLKKGDEADQRNDNVNALRYYQQAKDVDSTNMLMRLRAGRKIKALNEKMEAAAANARDLYKKYIAKAQTEENNREYDLAINDYQNAIKQQPDEGHKFDDHIRELNARYSVLSELNERFKQGQYKEVINEYKKAIKEKGDNSDFELGMAQCYDKMNDLKRALESYNKSYDLDQRNLKALECRADLYSRNNDPYKAIRDYKLYLTIEKENTRIYQELSRLHTQLNSNEEAIQDLDHALEVNPKAAPVYFSKGLLLLQKNDYKNASDNFTTCLRIDSSKADAFYNRGKCQLALKSVDNAAGDFARARERGLDSTSIRNVHSFAEDFYQHSITQYDGGRIDSAIRDADHAIAIDPGYSQYRYKRGEYYYAKKDYKEAVNSYDKAIWINANFHDALYRRGLAYHHLAEYKQAIGDFATVLKGAPADGMAQRATGDAYFALRDYGDASNFYEAALRAASSSKPPIFDGTALADIYNNKGKSYLELGQHDKALADFKSAIRSDKNFALAYYNRGETYYQTGQLSDAIEDMSKAISLQGTPPCKWPYTLAKAYQAKKDYTNAASYYTSCINLDSATSLPDAVYNLGRCQSELQNFPGALTSYNKALSLHLDTAVATFHLEMGSVYLHAGKFDSAYACYNTVYAKDTTNGFALYGLASAQLLAGKTDESLVWFDKCFQTKMVKYNDAKKDKLIAKIWDDKRFQALKRKYN